MAEATVRAAAATDIAALARIAERSYARGFADILSPADLAARTEAHFVERFSHQIARMTVVLSGDRPAGFATVTDGHVDQFFLDPDHFGRGVGRVLIDHIVADGARSLECFADNRAARRFYEKSGWVLERAYARDYMGRPMDFVRYIRLPA